VVRNVPTLTEPMIERVNAAVVISVPLQKPKKNLPN